METAQSWLRGTRKEWSHVIMALLLVLGATAIYSYPIYYEYDAPGEMISVQDIGIDGSVHFVTVYFGVTDNLIDKYMTEWSMDEETQFTRIDPYFAEEAADLGDEEKYREETITHALKAVMPEEQSEQYHQRLNEVLAETEGIYGDSLGLMVAIGMTEELYGVDYSRGGRYVIAGTGTMEEDLTVGSIGALEQKLILAERQGVTHFFIPKDKDLYGEWSNETEAETIVEERGMTLQIVPVVTLDEALAYLDALP